MSTLSVLPTDTLLVGVGHKAQHGKDTFSNYLHYILDTAGLVTRRYSFAEALYEECRSIHGMKGKDAPLLQKHGVERRGEDPLYWVRKVAEEVKHVAPRVGIISDVRFQNELDWVRNSGGITVRVTRYADGVPYVDPSRPADHESETALDGATFDLDIINAHGLDWLMGAALDVASIVFGLVYDLDHPDQVDTPPAAMLS